jgi:hypothetical protein
MLSYDTFGSVRQGLIVYDILWTFLLKVTQLPDSSSSAWLFLVIWCFERFNTLGKIFHDKYWSSFIPKQNLNKLLPTLRYWYFYTQKCIFGISWKNFCSITNFFLTFYYFPFIFSSYLFYRKFFFSIIKLEDLFVPLT